jgi:hypothetical protein
MQQRVKKRRLRPISGFSFLRSSLLPPRDRPRTPGRAGRSSSLRCGGRLARRRLPPETGIAFAPRRAGGARSLLSPRLKTRAVRDGHQGPGRSFAQHPAPNGFGLSKSAASRRFVALSAARLKEWMARDLSGLGLLVIQIDGIHMDEDMTLVAAIGVDANGDKHPLGLVEGATENAATVQALIDNLVERGLDPALPRLFIIDGSKALSKAIRAAFGRDVAIQRCQIHKARNIMDRLPKSMHAQVRRVLRQAWELDDAGKAEMLLRNLVAALCFGVHSNKW